MIEKECIGLSSLAEFISQKTIANYDRQHIQPVLKILFEEMLIEIKKSGLDIIGFGRFEIRQMKNHGHNDINNTGNWVVSPGLKKMRCLLEKPLWLLLIDKLSRRKSFPLALAKP